MIFASNDRHQCSLLACFSLLDIPEGENIAVNKPAQQYDRYANADANDAPAFVDGNINSIMHSNSYSTTGWWFYVDLGRIGPVSYIVIYNRPGLCK